MFKFSADAQLMFTVQPVTGGKMVVYFSETDSWGRSSFLTTNEAVARAIMGHSFFKHGRIELVSSETDKKEDKQEKVVFSEPEPKAEEAPVTEEPKAETPEVQETTEDDNNLVFANITIAKDYLNRRFGVNKSDIRSMTKVMAFAESKGLNITIGNGEE